MWYLYITDLCHVSFGKYGYPLRIMNILCRWLTCHKRKDFKRMARLRKQWERET
jgi:hypothetical protein